MQMSFMGRIHDYAERRVNLKNAPSGKTNKFATLLKRLGLAFVDSTGSAAKKDFVAPDFDLDEITNAYNTDSYIRQAIDKYVDLIFKSGWSFTGKNQAAVDYIKLRLAVMAEATSTPTKQFLLEMAEDLVKYGNIFIVKSRATGSYTFPPGISVTQATDVLPVAGYFLLPPTTMKIAREENGTIANYEQEVSGKTAITFKPADIIHVPWKKERGEAFGVPFLVPVIEDVKILRQIEEDVIRLIYRHLFPLYTYKVGLAQPGYEASDEEIDIVREEIRAMPMDGGIVIPERHEISVVGAEGQALDVHNYLEYFRKRVFTGLGVSESIMGIGDSSNRSTAESMTGEMHDRIKAFQRVMAESIGFYILNELLREGGFDPLLNVDDIVEFQFKEIDLDMQTKLENMTSQLWINNMIPFEEMRQILGRDPVVDEARLYANMVQAAITDKETESEIAIAKATPTATSTTKSTTKKTAAKVEESYQVSNPLSIDQYKVKLSQYWDYTQSDVVELVKQYYLSQDRDFSNFDPKEISSIVHLTKESISRISDQYLRNAFLSGTDQARNELNASSTPMLPYEVCFKQLNDANTLYMNRLLEEDLTYQLKVAIRSATREDALSKVIGAFEALQFRLEFIADYHLRQAYFYGIVRCASALGCQTVQVQTTGNCELCMSHKDQIIDISSIQTVSAFIPPFHPSCTCSIKLIQQGGVD